MRSGPAEVGPDLGQEDRCRGRRHRIAEVVLDRHDRLRREHRPRGAVSGLGREDQLRRWRGRDGDRRAIEVGGAGRRGADDVGARRGELAAREGGETGPVRRHGVRGAAEAEVGDARQGDRIAGAHVPELVLREDDGLRGEGRPCRRGRARSGLVREDRCSGDLGERTGGRVRDTGRAANGELAGRGERGAHGGTDPQTADGHRARGRIRRRHRECHDTRRCGRERGNRAGRSDADRRARGARRKLKPCRSRDRDRPGADIPGRGHRDGRPSQRGIGPVAGRGARGIGREAHATGRRGHGRRRQGGTGQQGHQQQRPQQDSGVSKQALIAAGFECHLSVPPRWCGPATVTIRPGWALWTEMLRACFSKGSPEGGYRDVTIPADRVTVDDQVRCREISDGPPNGTPDSRCWRIRPSR